MFNEQLKILNRQAGGGLVAGHWREQKIVFEGKFVFLVF